MDIDYSELSQFVYGRQLSSDHCRRMMSGSSFTLDLLENNNISDNTPINSKQTTIINSDNTQTSESQFFIEDESKLRDFDYLLRLHNYDPSLFELVNAKNSKWNVSQKDKENKVLYSSKITVKPKSEINLNDIKEILIELNKNSKRVEYQPKQYEYGAEYLVPCLFDIHFGKLGDRNESGLPYDYKIARNRMIESTKKYIDRLSGRKFEKIIFAIGNDYFNSEANGMTTGLTPQNNDTRYSKMFKKGIETLIEIIDLFSNIAPVKVILVQGNHSFYTEYYAACVLSAWYKDSKNIEVDDSPTTRKYEHFGKVLLGFTHGSEEKDRIYGLMQNEVPELWGNSNSCREWLIGHLHSEGVTEKNGVVVRRIPSITGNDFWHTKSGFTTSKQRSMAFIYDKEDGLIETHYVNI